MVCEPQIVVNAGARLFIFLGQGRLKRGRVTLFGSELQPREWPRTHGALCVAGQFATGSLDEYGVWRVAAVLDGGSQRLVRIGVLLQEGVHMKGQHLAVHN